MYDDFYDEFEDDLCHQMATDELEIYQELSYIEDFEAFYEAFEKRRELLNELDKHRVKTLAYQHDAIQDVFNRLKLPFKTS